ARTSSPARTRTWRGARRERRPSCIEGEARVWRAPVGIPGGTLSGVQAWCADRGVRGVCCLPVGIVASRDAFVAGAGGGGAGAVRVVLPAACGGRAQGQ